MHAQVASSPADGTSTQQGLSGEQARQRLAQDGPNELPVSKPRSVVRVLADVVSEPMFLLLVACGAIYMLLGDRHDAAMLLGFVFVVMGISFVQQQRTERSLDALRDLSSPRALALRDGQLMRIAGRELVCGDVVVLAEGDRVPADLELLAASNLMVDESLLTGESVPVDKLAVVQVCGDGTAGAPGDPTRVYSGTLVTQGTARGLVIATGARSALGRIGQSLAAMDSEATPVQRETQRVVKQVALVGIALAAGLAGAYWATTGDGLRGLLVGLTLAMAILPEELPVVLTIFLGLGAWRLARENVLARSIPAIEMLGATTVLCVDKTGTLTANRMAVRQLWCETTAYDTVRDAASPLQEALHGVLEYAVLASHRRAFDPMETAIGDSGQRLLADTEHLHADWTLVDDYPLSREMLVMSRVWQSPDLRARMIAAKGAPEAIVDLCHLDAQRSADIARQVAAMAGAGLRVLGVAQATFDAAQLPGNQHDFDFEFLGLIALEDPLRADVPKAIAECHAAGIRVVMITGDHPSTARSIAAQAGLDGNGMVLTGAELDALDDAALRDRLADVHIFCRVQPEQKLRLVQAFRARGDVVAMTGDGVNDAPALKAAHIGVAMGARGTDVAREAADLVLLNDDFSSLVTAVRYGRRVFANLRKAIVFVVAVHVPIVGLSLLPVAMGWPLLLLPVHILFLQLIIDPACSVVFEAEPLEASAMTDPPRKAGMRLFDRAVLVRGLCQGAGLLVVLLVVFSVTRSATQSDQAARAMVFAVLVLSNLGLIHVNRSWGPASLRGPAVANPSFVWISLLTVVLLACVLAIPLVSQLFAFVLPPAGLWLGALASVLLSLLWFELVKWLFGQRVRAVHVT
ncbi:MAG: cation-translocating P-type ATPase [Burkholderiales bacterium]|nr:cation-translocating P-type ATPase [Burkholderiales bacterium]